MNAPSHHVHYDLAEIEAALRRSIVEASGPEDGDPVEGSFRRLQNALGDDLVPVILKAVGAINDGMPSGAITQAMAVFMANVLKFVAMNFADDPMDGVLYYGGMTVRSAMDMVQGHPDLVGGDMREITPVKGGHA